MYVVTVETCGDPVTGLWCDRCALPSRVALVVLIAGTHPRVMVWCTQHGQR